VCVENFSRKNAQAAVHLLPKTSKSNVWSQLNNTDFVGSQFEVAYLETIRSIGSQESIIPTAAFYRLRPQMESGLDQGISVCISKYINNHQFFLRIWYNHLFLRYSTQNNEGN